MDIIKYLLDMPPRKAYQLLRRGLQNYKCIESFDEMHPCIFVLSTGRVGTETLATLFSLSSNLAAYHEPRPIMYALSQACYQTSNLEPEKMLCEAFNALRSEYFNVAFQSGKGYVETSPQATFIAPIIQMAIPNAKFIHLVRHPAEVVRSGMRRGWYRDHSADVTRITPRSSDPYYSQWKEMSQLQKNIWLWTETNRWISDFLSMLPKENKLILRSEDLFRQDWGTLEKLYSFSSSEMPLRRKIQKILARKLNSQKDGDFPNFSNWSRYDIAMLEKIGYEVMSVIGYSLNSKLIQ